MFCVGSVSWGHFAEGGYLYEFLGVGVMSALTFLCNMLVKVDIQRLRRL